LQRNPDILMTVVQAKADHGCPKVTVGFAAESQDLIENAQAKLKTKKLDLIVANDISAGDAGFNVDTNRVTLLYADGQSKALPLMSKAQVSTIVLDHVIKLLQV
jgi:phosphopantothenoylcysteine decarboxylase/phosphopantothenate--cysteine ligase